MNLSKSGSPWGEGMLAGVKQIHKPDYRSACSHTLSLSIQQIHSHISFLKPWDYWIFANINPWLYVPLPYSSKKFKEETLPLGVLEVFQWCFLQWCFLTYFPQGDNKGVQSFGSAPWPANVFPHLVSTADFLWFPLSGAVLPKERCSIGQSIKWGYSGGPPGLHSWHFIEQDAGCRMWQDSSPQQRAPSALKENDTAL